MPQGPTGGLVRRQAEREFYYRHLSGNFPQKKIQQLEREYYLSYLNLNGGAPANASGMTLTQLFVTWAKKFIAVQGHTPPAGGINYPAQLWRQIVVAAGFGAQVSKNINDNRFTFYLNG